MALRDDVDAGLAALPRPERLSLDESGACEIAIRMPPSITKSPEARLVIRVKVSRSGHFFTLLAPIAQAAKDLPAHVLSSILCDQFSADRTEATSYSYNVETGAIFATYHW